MSSEGVAGMADLDQAALAVSSSSAFARRRARLPAHSRFSRVERQHCLAYQDQLLMLLLVIESELEQRCASRRGHP